MRFGFPLGLLRFLFQMYQSERLIIIGAGIAAVARPKKSIVAGCSFADIMLFLIMVVVEAELHLAVPRALIAVVADDL